MGGVGAQYTVCVCCFCTPWFVGGFYVFFRSKFQILDLQSEEDSFRNTSIPERKPLLNLGQFLHLVHAQ